MGKVWGRFFGFVGLSWHPPRRLASDAICRRQHGPIAPKILAYAVILLRRKSLPLCHLRPKNSIFTLSFYMTLFVQSYSANACKYGTYDFAFSCFFALCVARLFVFLGTLSAGRFSQLNRLDRPSSSPIASNNFTRTCPAIGLIVPASSTGRDRNASRTI